MNAFSVILQDEPIILIIRSSSLYELTQEEVKILSRCTNCKAIVFEEFIIISSLFGKDFDGLKFLTNGHSVVFELTVLNGIMLIKLDFVNEKSNKYQQYTPCKAIDFMLANNYQIYYFDDLTGFWENKIYLDKQLVYHC
ncbi:MAG: hypothetical protein PHT78_06835 [Desulfitobacteriaceae bacterium]|nr:hypothetical protein [Desulfitobacteriaceae bacterium]MDD4752952.1 hypothetical protein [Desulfitobacteriaceae bacterium]